MVKKATKHSKTVSAKKDNPTVGFLSAVQKEQKKLFSAECDNVKNIMNVAQDFDNKAVKYVAMESKNIKAFAKSDNVAANNLLNIRNEILESCNRNILNLTNFSQEVFAVRNIKDLAELKNKSLQLAYNNYLDTTGKLCGMIFNSCVGTIAPINE